MGFHVSNRQKAAMRPLPEHQPLMQSKLFNNSRFRLGVNEEVTRILRLPTDLETREPTAVVMVKDLMSSKLGGGVEKEKTIVAGDLVRVDKMVILHHLFVESKHVLPTYFEDFIEKRVDRFDGKQQ